MGGLYAMLSCGNRMSQIVHITYPYAVSYLSSCSLLIHSDMVAVVIGLRRRLWWYWREWCGNFRNLYFWYEQGLSVG